MMLVLLPLLAMDYAVAQQIIFWVEFTTRVYVLPFFKALIHG